MPFAPGGCRETTITDRNQKKIVGRNDSVTLTEFMLCKYLSIFLVLIKSQIIAFIYSPLSGAV